MLIPKGLIKKMEWILHNTDDIYALVIDKRAGTNSERVGKSYSNSSPTEIQAIKNMTPIPYVVVNGGFKLTNPEAWIECVDILTETLEDSVCGKVFYLKYRKHLKNEEVAKTMVISRQYFHVLLNTILIFMYGICMGKKLINPHIERRNIDD